MLRFLTSVTCLSLIFGVLLINPVHAQTNIGEISTTFRLIGPNDKVVDERYDDPRVKNASCYVSRAQTGGLAGWAGFAESPSRFSIACRGVGVVKIPENIPKQEEIAFVSASFLTKNFIVSRMIDQEKRVLVYTIVSRGLIGGSPFNSISVIPETRERE